MQNQQSLYGLSSKVLEKGNSSIRIICFAILMKLKTRKCAVFTVVVLAVFILISSILYVVKVQKLETIYALTSIHMNKIYN